MKACSSYTLTTKFHLPWTILLESLSIISSGVKAKHWRLSPPYPARWKRLGLSCFIGHISNLVGAVEALPIISAQVDEVGDLSYLVSPVSSLVVAVEALSKNITTSIMKKQQALGGDLCRSVMVSGSLSGVDSKVHMQPLETSTRCPPSCSTSRWPLSSGTLWD